MALNEIGTRLQCPCGEWLGLTLTVGVAKREGDSYVLPISCDQDQFVQDFTAHVMADPTNGDHARFVKVVDGDD